MCLEQTMYFHFLEVNRSVTLTKQQVLEASLLFSRQSSKKFKMKSRTQRVITTSVNKEVLCECVWIGFGGGLWLVFGGFFRIGKFHLS